MTIRIPLTPKLQPAPARPAQFPTRGKVRPRVRWVTPDQFVKQAEAVYGYFVTKTMTREDAEDAYHDYVYYMLSNDYLARFDPTVGNLESFVVRYAGLFLRTWLVSRRRSGVVRKKYTDLIEQTASFTAAPKDAARYSFADLVAAATRRLSADSGETLHAVAFHGRNIPAVAARLNVTVTDAKDRISSLRADLARAGFSRASVG